MLPTFAESFGRPPVTTPTNQLSVIVPVFDDAPGLAAVLGQLADVLPGSGLAEYEVIVVDDGSRDDPAAVARGFAEVRLFSHGYNRGYGAALKTGVRHARYDLVCITDADGTYLAEVIPEMVARLREQGCDMVVGARTGRVWRSRSPAGRPSGSSAGWRTGLPE